MHKGILIQSVQVHNRPQIKGIAHAQSFRSTPLCSCLQLEVVHLASREEMKIKFTNACSFSC
jgi:hypothetical protein